MIRRSLRSGEVEHEAKLAFELLCEGYGPYLQAMRANRPSEPAWPLETYLCFRWCSLERLFRSDLQELIKQLFWNKGQAQLAAEQREFQGRLERYDMKCADSGGSLSPEAKSHGS